MSKNRIVSVNLNQIHTLTSVNHGLVIFNQKVLNVCLVGHVLNVDTSNPAKTIYKVTDFTSRPIEAILWLNTSNANSSILNQIREHTYCKLYGHVKKTGNDITIIVLHIETLANLNEMTIHLLEVVKHAIDMRKIKLQNIDQNNNPVETQLKPMKICGLSNIQLLVLQEIQESDNQNGILLDDICSNLRSICPNSIKDSINFLLSNEHIYETYDKQYKSCS